MKTYPVADRIPYEERKRLGLTIHDQPSATLATRPQKVKAVATGEKRPPRAGEWYLSGAIVEAYRAPNDLTTPYHIARLVRVRQVVTEVIEEEVSVRVPSYLEVAKQLQDTGEA